MNIAPQASSWLSRRQARTALPPVVGFAAATAILLAGPAGWRRWAHLSGGSQVLLAAAVAVGVFLVATVIMLLLPLVTRLYEGYWGDRRPGRRLAERGRRRESRRRDNSAAQTRYWAFPPSPEPVMPTRLGNVLRAAEAYPADQRRYGVDAVFFWPRLYPLLPDAMHAELADSRAAMETLLLTSGLALLFVPVAIGAAAAGAARPVAAAVSAAAAVATSLASYRLAVRAARGLGELVRASFDVYRRDLLTAMGFPLPDTLAAERELWRAVGQQLYRRGADREDLLGLRPDQDP